MIQIQIKNMAQIRSAFRQAPVIMTHELNTAIRRSIFMIEADSKKNTPVDTGRLRASTASNFSNLRGEVGTHVFYDIFVHWGTRYMRARPFLLNAVRTNEATIDREFTQAVQRGLDNIGGMT